MRKKQITCGAVFLIGSVRQLGREDVTIEGGARLGKLVYQSNHFKNVIGFRPSENLVSPNLKADELGCPIFMNQVIYCGDSALVNGRWPVLAQESVTEAEKDMTIRLVANHLYRLDEVLRLATEDDYTYYKQQRIAGLKAVYTILNHLEEYFNRK